MSDLFIVIGFKQIDLSIKCAHANFLDNNDKKIGAET
jgi:hypothetical protein